MARTKIAYDFCPVPRQRDPRWKALRNVYGRHLFAELFLLSDGQPIGFAGEWDLFLCRELQIPGPQRTNFCRALRELQGVGLITISGQVIHVTYQGAAAEQPQSRSRAGREQLQSSSRAAAVQVDSSLDLTPRNDSVSIRQTDETDRQTDERESAREVSSIQPRPELIGFRWFAALWGRSEMDVPPLHSFMRAHQWIGSRTSEERDRVAQAVRADEWCQANKHLVSPDHLTKFWQRYLGGEAKPVAKADPREASARERVAKLKADYAEQIRRARAAGDEYRVCLLEAERDEKVPRLEARLAS